MKIDKLGWYKQRNGGFRKVVYLHDQETNFSVAAVDYKGTFSVYTIEGIFIIGQENESDLVEYIGEELPAGKKFSEKIDKLGWYRQRNTKYIKVIYIHDEEADYPVVAIDSNREISVFTIEGLFDESNRDDEDDEDLVEYVGTELPEELKIGGLQ